MVSLFVSGKKLHHIESVSALLKNIRADVLLFVSYLSIDSKMSVYVRRQGMISNKRSLLVQFLTLSTNSSVHIVNIQYWHWYRHVPKDSYTLLPTKSFASNCAVVMQSILYRFSPFLKIFWIVMQIVLWDFFSLLLVLVM